MTMVRLMVAYDGKTEWLFNITPAQMIRLDAYIKKIFREPKSEEGK